MTQMRKTFALFLAVILIIPLLSIQGTAQNISTIQVPHAENILLVQFENNLPEVAKEKIRANANLELDKILNNRGLERMIVNGNRPLETVILQLGSMPGVEYAEPDYILYAIEGPVEVINANYAQPSNDTYFDLLWGLNNTGQAGYDSQGNLLFVGDGVTDIDALEAWDITAGSDAIIVAVIDTAVDTSHPDLQGKVTDTQKFHRGPAVYDHGTHVAGTIAALDNNLGVIGIAPEVQIMSLAFLGSRGGYTSDAITAINYASQNGAHIINASWGGGGESTPLKEAILSFQGPFVAAAGNDNEDTDTYPHYPSSYDTPNIVSVVSASSNGTRSSFSNYGSYSTDIAAPGDWIASTYPGGYAYMSGTSMAAPHVAGILALMKSYNDQMSTTSLIETLYSSGTADDDFSEITRTGKIANANNALLALSQPSDTIPPTLVTTTPLDGDIDIALETPIIVSFSEEIVFSNNYNEGVEDSFRITINGAYASAIISGNDVVITTPAPLENETLYNVFLPEGIIEDLNSNSFVGSVSYSFTTLIDPEPSSDTTPPVLSSTTPVDGAVDITLTTPIIVSFDEDVAFTNNYDEGMDNQYRITVNGANATAVINGNDVVITAPTPLENDTLYNISVPESTIEDLSNNGFVGHINYSFTTEAAPEPPPTGTISILNTSPQNGEINVSRSTDIVITLDQAFTSLDTSKLRIIDPNGNLLSYTISGLGSEHLTIALDNKLKVRALYRIILQQGAIMNDLGVNDYYDFSFTTGTNIR